ncbi:FlgO family outer membrane protein [Paraglaciecola sp. 2405UD69-4]|uniref:FlgO family outer membrane protein n=1 Tax=Paraglaciecola sp. 2405UD69-4 TaxID=3391836 RepID=UPI0039C9307E
MRFTIIVLFTSLILSGCSVFNNGQDDNKNKYAEDMEKNGPSTVPLQSSIAFQEHFKDKLTSDQAPIEGEVNSNHVQTHTTNASLHNINNYIKALTKELMSNLENVSSTTPVAIVSFVMLDSDYNQSNVLGNQIAESLIHEIHTHGIPVIDFKTTGYVRVTEQGDFAFSKDYEDFGTKLPADYVVGGTLAKHKEGYLVNARIVNFESKSVVATAQNFIPNDVANALEADMYKDETKLEISNIPKSNMVPLTSN